MLEAAGDVVERARKVSRGGLLLKGCPEEGIPSLAS